MTIREALRQLDPSNDGHWTTDGLPIVAVVAELVGEKSLTRDTITASDSEYCRAVAIEEAENAARKVRNEGAKAKTPKVTSEELAKQLAELGRTREKLDNQIRRLALQYSILLEEEARAQDYKGTSVNILYVRHQAKLRASQVQQMTKMAGILAGAGIEVPTVKAPIDKAMERKRGFGHNRPKASPEKIQ